MLFGWLVSSAYFTGELFGREGITVDTIMERVIVSGAILGTILVIVFFIEKLVTKYEIRKRLDQ